MPGNNDIHHGPCLPRVFTSPRLSRFPNFPQIQSPTIHHVSNTTESPFDTVKLRLLIMPSKSPFTIDIPATDVLSYLFPVGQPASDKPIWIDADNTSNSLSPRQLLQWAKRLCGGLQKLGLKKQDVVMMYSHNHIFVPVAYLGVSGCGCIFSGCNPAYGINGMVPKCPARPIVLI